ncbi:unnamed protein product [Caenorhabditis angaria]|uniref:Uncharacterized protein n=1 Tax=Caenorhabditis angaria TaxID=860376 RepID=A0A9P1MXY6_9PELO|nr:unnamed protein product [Caenorhabditis angaria]
MSEQCASQFQIDLYSTPFYFVITQVNLTVVLLSIIVAYLAVRELYSQSIINSTPRLFLTIDVVYAMIHQFSYFYIKIDLTYKILFKLDKPCELLISVYDCRFVSRGFIMGSSGLTLVQTAMTFDRLFATCYPKIHKKQKRAIGSIFTFFIILASWFTWDLLTINDPLNDYIQNCGYFPPKSQNNFDTLLIVSFFIAVFNFIINIINLKIQLLKAEKYHKQFNMLKRYNAMENTKNAQAITLLSTGQIFGIGLWNGSTYILRTYKKSLTPFQYALLLTSFYIPPYVCLFLPLLMIIILRRIREHRSKVIKSLRNQKETQDEYMDKMRKVWS